MDLFTDYFTTEKLAELFPPQRSNDFFEALFGEAEEGAFDIRLAYERYDSTDETLHLTLQLHERPGKCLACNLTYGLPEVFTRHPVINVTGLIKDIDILLGDNFVCEEWKLGTTQQQQSALHSIPLVISVKNVE